MTEQWADAPPEDGDLLRVSALADKQLEIERDLAAANAKVADLEKELTRVREELLPDAMRACGMREFVLLSGAKITITRKVEASIPEEKRGEAHAWARANGHGDLIKRTLEMSFGMGEDNLASSVAESMREQGAGTPVLDEERIAPPTLKALVRRLLEAKQAIPDCIWYRETRVSKVERPKKEEHDGSA